MSDFYRVELDGLQRLTTHLGNCANDMREAVRALGGIGGSGAGQAELEDACEAFSKAWSYGIGQMADAASDMTEGLSRTARVYGEMEYTIAKGFSGGGSGR